MSVMRMAAAMLVMAALVPGCSSRPREYRPMLAAAPAPETQAKFDADVAECHRLLVAGRLDKDGRLASAGAGIAAGGATMAAGAAAASSAGMVGGAGIAAATVVLIPFAAVGGAWIMANAKRGKKEKIIQQAMAGCLMERGHTIVGWEKTGRKMKVDPLAKRKAPAPDAGAN